MPGFDDAEDEVVRLEAVVAAQREALRRIAGQNPHSVGAERWSMKIARAALDAEGVSEPLAEGETLHLASCTLAADHAGDCWPASPVDTAPGARP